MLRIEPASDILAVIDAQPTFMPGGELAVPRGDEVVPIINDLMRQRFASAFATQDWHPPGHRSFASSHSGAAPLDTVQMPYGPQILWPDHAVQGTDNAALHPRLERDRLQMILRKGTNPEIDSYSAFLENDQRTSTGLAGWLRDLGKSRLFFCGLATDFCVAWSAIHAVELGFEAVLIEDASRGIAMPVPTGGDTLTQAMQTLAGRGVTIITSVELA